ITITLSAADATAHVLENPFVRENVPFLDHPILVTLALITFLGAVFLKGFKEAIGIAVMLVAVYLVLNLVVVVRAVYEVANHPELLTDWQNVLFATKASFGSFQI